MIMLQTKQLLSSIVSGLNEPYQEETSLCGLPPNHTQAGLKSYRDWLEAQNFRFRKEVLHFLDIQQQRD